MEHLYHPASDPELQAPDFVEAVTRFRSAVKEFTAAVNRLDDSIAAAIKVFAKDDPDANDEVEVSIPAGYHPPE